MSERDQILARVMAHMKWTRIKAMRWMTSPNPHFGDATPDMMIACGRGHRVMKFIESAEDENGPAEPKD